MGKNLFNKIWDLHKVGTLDSGLDQSFIGLHLIHEVTSPQALFRSGIKAVTGESFAERELSGNGNQY